MTRSPAMLPRTPALSLLPLPLKPPEPLGRQEERRSPLSHPLHFPNISCCYQATEAHDKVAENCPPPPFFSGKPEIPSLSCRAEGAAQSQVVLTGLVEHVS